MNLLENLNIQKDVKVNYLNRPFALNVNLTPHCNLNCHYCFAQGGGYGTISKAMDESFAERVVDIIKQECEQCEEIRLEYFGGEPLLNFSVIKVINSSVNEFLSNDHNGNKKLVNRISTNMTYLTSEMIDFFKENEFIFSISIDGGEIVQNRNRPCRNGNGSFKPIITNIKKIRNLQKTQNIIARITYHDVEDGLLENVEELLQLELFDYVSIYPSISTWKDKDESFRNDVFQQFINLIENYDNLRKKYKRFKGILEFDQIISQFVASKKTLHHCRAGTRYFTLSSDNKIVACHRLVGDEEYNRDNVAIETSWKIVVDQIEECSNCEIRNICGGGCRQENIIETGDFNKPSRYVCQYQKTIVLNILKEMDILKKYGSSDKLNELAHLFTYCGRQTL